MSTNNADRLDPSVASTTSSREHMPPPPPRMPQESAMHDVNSRGGDFGTSGGQQPSLEEPSVDSTLSALSFATADTDTILAHWRKQRHNNGSIAAVGAGSDLRGAREGKESVQSAFRKLHVTTEEHDDDVFNYSDSFSIVQSDNRKNHSANRASLGLKAACARNEDDLHSANTSPILNGHNRRSAFPSQIRHIDGSNETIPEGEISLLQSYNSVDEHISLQDFNSVAPNESPYKHIRPQNPQHTHFETDLSIISHSSESVSSAFLAGLRTVGDTAPNVHKPLVTPRVVDSNGSRRAVRGFDRSPNGQNKNNGQNNSELYSVEERDKTIRQLELEVMQWKKGHADLDSVKQQQSGLIKEIEQLKQNVEQYTSQYNSLCETIEVREEELTSLKADVQFAQTEKEEMQIEYEKMKEQISQLTAQLDEERDALAAVEFEKKEASIALEKAKADLDRILKETEATVTNCKARELEVTKLVEQADEASKKLRADENRLLIDRKKLDAERTTLDKEKKMLTQQQKDSSEKFRELDRQLQTKSQNLADEKKQISLVQDELLLVQSAQSETAAKLKRDEATLEEYSRQMKQQMETLLGREKSCSDLEALVESRMENLSAREKSCSKHEEDIAARANDLTGREQTCSKRELELEEALKKMTQLEVELSQKVEDLAARDAVLTEREQNADRAASETKKREQSCIDKERALENQGSELLSKEQDLSAREHALSKREAECEELENELVDAGDALSQREQLCAQQLEDANEKIERFIDREQAVCKREEEVNARAEQLVEQEQLLAEKSKKIDLVEKTVTDRETACSKKENHCNERLRDVEEKEKSVNIKEGELKSQQNVLELEIQAVEKMKQDFQLDRQKSQNELEEESRRLIKIGESHDRMKHQLDTQEQALLAAKTEMDNLMTKMEEEQNRLVEKEASLVEAMSEIKEHTDLNNQKEKELNKREEGQLLKSKEFDDAKSHFEEEKSNLQLKTIDILAREKALAESAESSKKTQQDLRQREASLLSLEEQLQSKEKQLLARDQAMHSRLAEITERENLVEQSADLNFKISQEEKRFNELQSKCEAAADKLQQLQDEASNLRPVLSEAVTRFETESKELEDITRRKQVLSHEVSMLTEKAKTANEEEERSRNAVARYEKQQQDFISRMQQEKDSFEKSLELKSNEFVALQQQSRHRLEAKTRSAMKQLCQNQAEVFEGASRELSYRHEQIELMVSNISEFRMHFASWIKEKETLSKQLGESVESQNKCSALLRKAENDLLHTQRQCARLQASLEEQNTHNIELEREKSDLRVQKSRLEKAVSDLETAKLACQQELDLVKSSKNIHLEQKAQKLKELMQSITLQNDRLQKKQKSLDEREVALVAREHQLQEKADKNDELYQLVQRQNIALKSLEQDLDDCQARQMTKEQELNKHEERLVNMETRLNQEQEEFNASKQKMKELALQLQKKNEEVNMQKQQLQEKLRGCDEYEATLSAWEQRLDEAANIMQMQQEDGSAS